MGGHGKRKKEGRVTGPHLHELRGNCHEADLVNVDHPCSTLYPCEQDFNLQLANEACSNNQRGFPCMMSLATWLFYHASLLLPPTPSPYNGKGTPVLMSSGRFSCLKASFFRDNFSNFTAPVHLRGKASHTHTHTHTPQSYAHANEEDLPCKSPMDSWSVFRFPTYSATYVLRNHAASRSSIVVR